MAKEKIYTKKENKGYLITILILVVVLLITVAILTLLTNRVDKIGNLNRNGLGRNFLLPFVFSDESNTAYIIKDSLQAIEIDDSALDLKHDLKKSKVFYIRNDVLYEYDIKGASRKALEDDVEAYFLLPSRTSIICIGRDTIRLYLFKSKKTIVLASGYKLSLNENPVIGENYFIYLDNVKNSKADLYLSDEVGKTVKLAENIDATRTFGIGKDDKYVFFYKDDILCFLNKKGEQVGNYPKAQIIKDSNQPLLVDSSTDYIATKNDYQIFYLLSNLSDDGKKGDLIYLKGKKSILISLDVTRTIYYSLDKQLLIFAKVEGNVEKVYFSRRGKEAVLLYEKEASTKYIFEKTKGYLYSIGPKGNLERVNIYDKKQETITISNNAAAIYSYKNKGIFVYEDIERDKQFYIMPDGKIEEEEINGKRLYGSKDDSYLYIRVNENQKIALDIVESDSMKRITSKLTNKLFFDKNLDQLLFQEGDKLFYWKDDLKTEIGDFSKIKSALLVD